MVHSRWTRQIFSSKNYFALIAKIESRELDQNARCRKYRCIRLLDLWQHLLYIVKPFLNDFPQTTYQIENTLFYSRNPIGMIDVMSACTTILNLQNTLYIISNSKLHVIDHYAMWFQVLWCMAHNTLWCAYELGIQSSWLESFFVHSPSHRFR